MPPARKKLQTEFQMHRSRLVLSKSLLWPRPGPAPQPLRSQPRTQSPRHVVGLKHWQFWLTKKHKAVTKRPPPQFSSHRRLRIKTPPIRLHTFSDKSQSRTPSWGTSTLPKK